MKVMLIALKNEVGDQQRNNETHSPWTRVGDFTSVRSPLVVVTVFVREGPIEDVSDISHRVHTHSRAFKHRAEEKRILVSYNKFNVIH